jgi:hypothetical protein
LGCVLSLPLVVVGHDHVRGPIGLLFWVNCGFCLEEFGTPRVAFYLLASTAMLLSAVVSNERWRVVLVSFAVMGLLISWFYLELHSMFLAWEYLSSVPFFLCLAWRIWLMLKPPSKPRS